MTDNATVDGHEKQPPVYGEDRNNELAVDLIERPPRVAVVGGRDFAAATVLDHCLDALATEKGGFGAIVSGGASGADSLAAAYARRRNIRLIEFRPDYESCRTPQERRRAPILRNASIIGSADMLVAFWDGRSSGTADSIRRARRANIPCYIYDYAGRQRAPESRSICARSANAHEKGGGARSA
jgi:hypothetical protein